jgi:hypothetical protein
MTIEEAVNEVKKRLIEVSVCKDAEVLAMNALRQAEYHVDLATKGLTEAQNALSKTIQDSL